MRRATCTTVMTLLLFAACGESDTNGGDELTATWTFEQGDCASNSVETVHITISRDGGESEENEFPCEPTSGSLGPYDGEGGSYAVSAEGRTADGAVTVASFGQTLNLQPGDLPPGLTVDVTLRPSPSNVTVSWTTGGSGSCPSGVILPYFITVYQPPAEEGGALSEKVAEQQESCQSGMVTLMGIAPGEYVVEVDSRATQPAVRGTAPLTVTAGEDASVNVDM